MAKKFIIKHSLIVVMVFLIELLIFIVWSPGNVSNTEAQFTQFITRVSVASDGSQGDGDSSFPSISADGRYIAFQSMASNFAVNDAYLTPDVFVHDTQTGQTTLISVDNSGQAGMGTSPSISGDGRFVAFYSGRNLVGPEPANIFSIYVRDLQTDQTTLASVGINGAIPNKVSSSPSISTDGRYVAYLSSATNIVPGDTNGFDDIFVYDRQAAQTVRVSLSSSGEQANGDSADPKISSDGRFVVFQSFASNLVSNDNNSYADVFVHDLQTGETSRASISTSGDEPNYHSENPSISDDGRYVVFATGANNLDQNDQDWYSDIFIRDRQAGTTSLVSDNDAQFNTNVYTNPELSGGGKYIVYAARFCPVFGSCGYFNIYVINRDTASAQLISTGTGGTPALEDSGSFGLCISTDGQFVAFESLANNLVVDDTNDVRDVFMTPGPGSNVSITHIEVTQVIQDLQNYVPLIANKPTFVRVYVDCGQGCTAQPNITGTLEVSSSAGNAVFSPDMGAITAYQPNSWTDQRGDLRKTLNFYTIPTNLLTGTVTFTAHVGSSTFPTTLPFTAGNKLRIAWVPINYQPNSPNPPNYRPDPALTYEALSYLSKIYPLGLFDLDYFLQPQLQSDQLTMSGTFSEENAWNEYLPALDRLWVYIDGHNGWYGGKPDRLFGWAPGMAKDPIDKFDGYSYATWFNQWGHSGSGRVAAGLTISKDEANWVLAHEIAHILNNDGLKHAPCGLPGGNDVDPNLPGGLIDDWGIDFINGKIPKLLSKVDTKDFMSYCHPDWASKYHYRKLVVGFQDYSQPNPLINTSQPIDANPVLSVYGSVFASTLEVDFGTLYPFDSFDLPDDNRGTEYCLQLRDVSEIILDSRCFDLSFTAPVSGNPLDKETFTFALPYPKGTHSVVLAHLGTELGRVTKSEHNPIVHLISPNGGESWDATGTYVVSWAADDIDGDPLHYIVSYSIDDGSTWMPLAMDITGDSFDVESQYLPGSVNARFKVTVSDQMNSSEDASDAPFSVGKKSPEIFILEPGQDSTVPPGTPLYLQGYGYDLEDITIASSSLRWSSDVDGDLGTGSTIIASLSPGPHTVTLSAVDSNGNLGFAVVHMYIGYKSYLPLVDK